MLLPLHACIAGRPTEAVPALQGKKEKKRREKKKEREIIPIGPPAEEEPRQSTFFDEPEREVSSTSCPGSAIFMYLRLNCHSNLGATTL